MGGSSSREYAEPKKIKESEHELEITNIQGETLRINKRFIVTIKDVQIVKNVHDTTAHVNYHGHKFAKHIVTQYYCVPTHYKIVLDKVNYTGDAIGATKIYSNTECS